MIWQGCAYYVVSRDVGFCIWGKLQAISKRKVAILISLFTDWTSVYEPQSALFYKSSLEAAKSGIGFLINTSPLMVRIGSLSACTSAGGRRPYDCCKTFLMMSYPTQLISYPGQTNAPSRGLVLYALPHHPETIPVPAHIVWGCLLCWKTFVDNPCQNLPARYKSLKARASIFAALKSNVLWLPFHSAPTLAGQDLLSQLWTYWCVA